MDWKNKYIIIVTFGKAPKSAENKTQREHKQIILKCRVISISTEFKGLLAVRARLSLFDFD